MQETSKVANIIAHPNPAVLFFIATTPLHQPANHQEQYHQLKKQSRKSGQGQAAEVVSYRHTRS
jgi:hypothetical protein